MSIADFKTILNLECQLFKRFQQGSFGLFINALIGKVDSSIIIDCMEEALREVEEKESEAANG